MSEALPTVERPGPAPRTRTVLVTGATGYVGGRLLRVLGTRPSLRLRAMARDPERLAGRVPAGAEAVGGDATDAASLGPALDGVDAAYYLIHSMGSSSGFERTDREAAETFGAAARRAGVGRIIYLGGLADPERELSPHLRSRIETGERLRAAGVPVVELRASIVLGSGSLSFELIRALVERLPVMVTPRWVAVEAQPIAVEDLLAYLAESLEVPLGDGAPPSAGARGLETEPAAGSAPPPAVAAGAAGEAPHRIFEIGGADRVSYGGLMREYARQRGLRRWMIPVPVLTPWLSSLWLGLITPLYARVGRKLIGSVAHASVVRDRAALEAFTVRPRGHREAIARAILYEDRAFAETRWSDAVSSGGTPRTFGGVRLGSRLVDSRVARVPVPVAAAFRPIRRIGGSTGWYHAGSLWRLRGWLDLLAGGVGLRRGRRDPERPAVGDTLDFWRVEKFEPDRLLRLRAEMKLPGRAWLEFEVRPEAGGSAIQQTAMFEPLGLLGLAYWYLLYPAHRWVFHGMLRRIARAAVEGTGRSASPAAAAPGARSGRSR